MKRSAKTTKASKAKKRATPKERLPKRVEEAISVLRDLGMPKDQVNERSALTLLALLDLHIEGMWVGCKNPLLGVTEAMGFMKKAFRKSYAPNTRETIRRYTLHQFVQAGIVDQNPDDPTRPPNSPNTVYRISAQALGLMRLYGTDEWQGKLKEYLISNETLKSKYQAEREKTRIRVMIAEGEAIDLSAGGQNVLIKKILEDFCEYFTPGAHVIYVGDAQKKWAYFKKEMLADIGVEVDEHGKIPDVVVYMQDKNWLVLIEAVTSHGPIGPKRLEELRSLFNNSKAGLVFVTAFLDKTTLRKHMHDIAWETEVWVAEHPTHVIHFNGERFLGPYDD
jgi:hypothetical protein